MSGVIVPAEWDEKGRTIRVAFAAHDERELEILPEGLGVFALERIRQEVEVLGVLRDGARGPALHILEIREVGPSPGRADR